jgi:hypothetical protein
MCILMCILTAGMHLASSFLFVSEAEVPLLRLAQFPFECFLRCRAAKLKPGLEPMPWPVVLD